MTGRRAFASSLVALTLAVIAAPVRADSHGFGNGDRVEEDGDVVVDVVRDVEGEDGTPTITPVVDDGLVTIRYSVIVFRGELCITTETDRVAPEDASLIQGAREAQALRQFESLASRGVLVRACPGATGRPGELSAALSYAEEVQGRLPRPDLSMPPGTAVTGLPMYLVNDQALTYRETQVVDLGGWTLPVTVEAVGSWRVLDWGDGSGDDVPHTSPSVGHGEDGLQVVHTYSETGSVAVTVVDTWTVTVSAPGLPPLSLPPVDLAPSMLPVEIEQLQPVGEG